MVRTAVAVRVPVAQFFLGRVANCRHLEGEVERFSCEGVVAVKIDLVAVDSLDCERVLMPAVNFRDKLHSLFNGSFLWEI